MSKRAFSEEGDRGQARGRLRTGLRARARRAASLGQLKAGNDRRAGLCAGGQRQAARPWARPGRVLPGAVPDAADWQRDWQGARPRGPLLAGARGACGAADAARRRRAGTSSSSCARTRARASRWSRRSPAARSGSSPSWRPTGRRSAGATRSRRSSACTSASAATATPMPPWRAPWCGRPAGLPRRRALPPPLCGPRPAAQSRRVCSGALQGATPTFETRACTSACRAGGPRRRSAGSHIAPSVGASPAPGGPACAQVRLLVDQTQVGCILGKGGSIISELRRATGSSIRVLSKQEIPACAAPNDEVLQVRRPGAAARVQGRVMRPWRARGLSRAGRGQVSGDAARVLDALQQASERLRETPSRQPIQLARTPQPVRALRRRCRFWPRPAFPCSGCPVAAALRRTRVRTAAPRAHAPVLARFDLCLPAARMRLPDPARACTARDTLSRPACVRAGPPHRHHRQRHRARPGRRRRAAVPRRPDLRCAGAGRPRGARRAGRAAAARPRGAAAAPARGARPRARPRPVVHARASCSGPCLSRGAHVRAAVARMLFAPGRALTRCAMGGAAVRREHGAGAAQGAADAAAPARRSVDVDFRVLVPDVLVGSVIGRGGDVVRRIRAETGARIKVFEGGRGAAPAPAGPAAGAGGAASRARVPLALLPSAYLPGSERQQRPCGPWAELRAPAWSCAPGAGSAGPRLHSLAGSPLSAPRAAQPAAAATAWWRSARRTTAPRQRARRRRRCSAWPCAC